MGYLSSNYLEKFIPSNWPDNIFIDMLTFVIPIYILLILYYVHIVIHELGHLVFGLATGFSFVSFRIGTFTVIKEDGQFRLKRFGIPGTAGQCLLMPPEIKDGKYPDSILYNLGGVILNTLLTLISILVIVLLDDLNLFLEFILILFSIAGLIAALSNGIPLKIFGVPNDGYNVMLINKDEEAKKGIYLQFWVNGLLSQGMRYRDIDKSLFNLKEGSDLTNPMNTSLRLMEFNYYLDKLDFDRARRCIESLTPYLDKIIPIYVNEINCERIFLELIAECDKELIDKLYSKNLKKYIKESKYMMNKKRLLMAYELFYNEDKDKVLDTYYELKTLYHKYPVKGEADMELMLADWIKGEMK